MSTSNPSITGTTRRTLPRRAAAAALVAVALAGAIVAAPGLVGSDRVAGALRNGTAVVVKPVDGTTTTIRAKGSSWALPATTGKRVVTTVSARGSSWS